MRHLDDAWRAPVYEPVKRNHDGLRHHRHRFPIKDGISIADVLAIQMSETNELLASMRFVE
jgi:hypothetical protein